MQARTVRIWGGIHKWTSLICTVFMLLLCLTGLPLIFHHEIHDWLETKPAQVNVTPDYRPADLDAMMAAQLRKFPDEVPLYLNWEEDDPREIYVTTARHYAADSKEMHSQLYDGATGKAIASRPFNEGFMYILLKLHTDLFLGMPGLYFLGLMGFLMLLALVSGVVLYAPFMRKQSFGVLRMQKKTTAWLDWHNLTGIVVAVWLIVVAATGVINTIGTPLIRLWQMQEGQKWFAGAPDQPARHAQTSVENALRIAREKLPEFHPGFIAYPGTPFTSNEHYLVFMTGNTPLTKRMGQAVLVNASSGEFTAIPEFPVTIKALLLSQPLHFGDYGGIALKIVWAVLDIVAIVVLYSGLVLWWRKRKQA